MKKTSINPATISNQFNYFKSKTKRTIEAFYKFLKNIWKFQNKGKFVSEDNYILYIKEIAKILCLPEQYFLNAQINQLEKWEIEMQTKPLFHKNAKKLRGNLHSGFMAYLSFCRYQEGLISFSSFISTQTIN